MSKRRLHSLISVWMDRTIGWPVSCTKNESFTRLHPQQVAGTLCLECQPLARLFPALPRPQVEATIRRAASAFGLKTRHRALALYTYKSSNKIIHVVCTTLLVHLHHFWDNSLTLRINKSCLFLSWCPQLSSDGFKTSPICPSVDPLAPEFSLKFLHTLYLKCEYYRNQKR